MVDGHPTLAVAGEWRRGPAIDSEPIGYAVAFWQEAEDKATSVASFHLRTSRSTTGSVLVTRYDAINGREHTSGPLTRQTPFSVQLPADF